MLVGAAACNCSQYYVDSITSKLIFVSVGFEGDVSFAPIDVVFFRSPSRCFILLGLHCWLLGFVTGWLCSSSSRACYSGLSLATSLFCMLIQRSMFPLIFFIILYMPVYSDLLVSSLVSFWFIKFLTFDKKIKIIVIFWLGATKMLCSFLIALQTVHI